MQTCGSSCKSCSVFKHEDMHKHVTLKRMASVNGQVTLACFCSMHCSLFTLKVHPLQPVSNWTNRPSRGGVTDRRKLWYMDTRALVWLSEHSPKELNYANCTSHLWLQWLRSVCNFKGTNIAALSAVRRTVGHFSRLLVACGSGTCVCLRKLDCLIR